MIGFWRWLFVGSGAGPGLRRIFNFWLLLHVTVGIVFSLILPISLEQAAINLLFPIAGIFIGLSFAWGGNAQALLQTKEIEEFSKYHDGGFLEYIYTYQLSILLILLTLVLWGIAGLGVFDRVWPVHRNSPAYNIIIAFLFFWSSITLRECWHVVLASQLLLLVRTKIREQNKNNT